MKTKINNSFSVIKVLPSFLTITSLLIGLFAIHTAIDNYPIIAIKLIMVASIFDLLDGKLARLLKATSEFGTQLDSLSDLTTFGVAPSFIIYYCLTSECYPLGWISSCLFIVAALLRLARFNILSKTNMKYSSYFFGIPVPAGALLLFLPFYLSFGFNIVIHNTFTCCYCIIIALLMVSNIPTFSTKNLRINRKYFPIIIAGITLVILLLIYYTWIVLFISTIIYIISIPFTYFTFLKNNKRNFKVKLSK